MGKLLEKKIIKLKHWFFRKKDYYSKFDLEDFAVNAGIIVGLSLIFGAVYSNSEKINSANTGIIRIGGIIQLILIIFIVRSVYKILKNLNHSFGGLANGYKLSLMALLILFGFYIYQNPGIVVTPLSEFDYTSFSPIDTRIFNKESNLTQNNTNSQSLVCCLSANTTIGTEPLTVTFNITANSARGNISFWAFDVNSDGILEYSGTGQPPKIKQYTYHTSGKYTAKIMIMDTTGISAHDEVIIKVNEIPNVPPNCKLAANPISGNFPLTVTFTLSTSDSDGTISSWSLDVNGDGSAEYSGNGTPPATKQHTYNNAGIYTAKFSVKDNDQEKKTSSVTITVYDMPSININELENQIHVLVNAERTSQGLQPLQYDTQLADIAREHSKDMAVNNYFSHTNLEGQGPTERAKAAGYDCYKNYGSYYTDGIAENIMQNWLYSSKTIEPIPKYNWKTQSEIASSTVEGWMNSPGHRSNILNSNYDKEGIGVAIASDYKVYITQDFW